MKHDKVDISWWTVENREIKLTDKALGWNAWRECCDTTQRWNKK